ncbi:MAG: aspartate dehydrogenase domain-containing protein [Elusimicrobiota bacterium]
MDKINKTITKLSIIGCGNIGRQVVKSIITGKVPGIKLAAVYDINPEQAAGLAVPGIKICKSIDSAVHICDLVLECASPAAVPVVAQAALKYRTPTICISINGLLLNKRIIEKYKAQGVKLHLPSGAIAGVDAVKAAAVCGIKNLMLTTTKSPASLASAPYVLKHKIDLSKLTSPKCIFSGTVYEAAKSFPVNINVAAVLAAATEFRYLPRVKIVADPDTKINSHEICISGEFGDITTHTHNIPSPDNPKTSYLAVLSVIALLKQLTSDVRVGT